MDAIQEFEQYCALHPDPWYQANYTTSIPLLPLQWPQQSTPPAPQEAKKEEAKQLLYQATVEDDTETTAESTMHGNSMAVSKSMLSTKACLCTTPASRDPAACPSNLLASSFGSFFDSFLASFSASRFGFGYIEYKEGMEATGEGWIMSWLHEGNENGQCIWCRHMRGRPSSANTVIG